MQNKRTSFQALILALFLSFSLLMAPLANAAFQTDKVYSTLSEKGVISDIDNFRPGDYCTRAEFYKMALSVAKIQADEAQKMPFKDVKLTQWYAKYIWTALNLGIIEASDKRHHNSRRSTANYSFNKQDTDCRQCKKRRNKI